MKLLVSIFILFTNSLSAQTIWNLTPTRERLYKEIADGSVILALGYFEDEDEDPTLWKKADSLFADMPLKVAFKYYLDSSYSIRYYSFMKILGENDTLAFKLLSQYISDTTKIIHQFEDLVEEVPFNEFLANAYETFIDSKYYWCDNKGILYRKYFRKKPFVFPRINYTKWPEVLTNFIQLLKPRNIKHRHQLSDLKYYHGIKHFHGR